MMGSLQADRLLCSVRKVNGTNIYGTGQIDKTPGHN